MTEVRFNIRYTGDHVSYSQREQSHVVRNVAIARRYRQSHLISDLVSVAWALIQLATVVLVALVRLVMELVAAVVRFFVREGEKQQALDREQNAAYQQTSSEASPFITASATGAADDDDTHPWLSNAPTGARQVTPHQVTESQHQAQLALRHLETARRHEKTVYKQTKRYSRQVTWLGKKLRWRQQLGSGFPPAGWLVISSSLGIGLGVVPGLILLSSVGWSVLLGVIGLTVGISAPTYLFYVSDTQALVASQNRTQGELHATREEFEQAQRETAELQQQYNSARATHQELKDALTYQTERERLASRSYRLSVTSWQTLSGIPFEEFLAEVLREHSYRVDLTSASNDQGVDLIAAAGDQRIAIQAKGYPSGNSVGNDAVLKVAGGMKFYDCSSCAVITNSYFTSQAIHAASGVDCHLIDADAMPKLIRGSFPWG